MQALLCAGMICEKKHDNDPQYVMLENIAGESIVTMKVLKFAKKI